MGRAMGREELVAMLRDMRLKLEEAIKDIVAGCRKMVVLGVKSAVCGPILTNVNSANRRSHEYQNLQQMA